MNYTPENTNILPACDIYQVERLHIVYDTGEPDEWYCVGEPLFDLESAIRFSEIEMGGTRIPRRVRNTVTQEIHYWYSGHGTK